MKGPYIGVFVINQLHLDQQFPVVYRTTHL